MNKLYIIKLPFIFLDFMVPLITKKQCLLIFIFVIILCGFSFNFLFYLLFYINFIINFVFICIFIFMSIFSKNLMEIFSFELPFRA